MISKLKNLHNCICKQMLYYWNSIYLIHIHKLSKNRWDGKNNLTAQKGLCRDGWVKTRADTMTEENRSPCRLVVQYLTILLHLDFDPLMFPKHRGRRRTDDITDNVGVVSFIKLLGWRGIFEGDFFYNTTWETFTVKIIKKKY